MKSKTNNKLRLFFRVINKFSHSIAIFFSLLMLSTSCSYFTVKDVPTSEETISKQIKEFNAEEKYVIIHSGEEVWHFDKMIINDDLQTISGSIKEVSKEHVFVKHRDAKRTHRYKYKDKKPLNEIHFYLAQPKAFNANESVSISLENIERISVNEKNVGKSVGNVLLGTVGSLVVITLLYAALKSSCPFVFIKNGDDFEFVGELYPGTITANMQEYDYLKLSGFKSENGNYTLKVANQLKEIQYTDQLQLMEIVHDSTLQVLLDSKGRVQTFQELMVPDKLLNSSEGDVQMAFEKDFNYFTFNGYETSQNSTRSLEFSFEKPLNANSAKLYLTAKNSAWLDYIFGKFNEQFGSYYNTFQKQQQKVPKEDILNWRNNQNLPLSVYVKTQKGWELVERIGTVGPLAMRDIVVPLNFEADDSGSIEIKLETGFMFWEVDYVAIDYSQNKAVDINYIQPDRAIDNEGKDVTALLKFADGKYFVQPNIGDEVHVNFKSSFNNLYKQKTIFLKNRGYYNYIRDYDGLPDKERLENFRNPSAFSRFSENSYLEYINYGLNNIAQNE